MSKRRNILLKIPAIVYGWGVGLRNFAFDTGLIKPMKPSIPTICIGNLSVGGTGKTPHIEWLIRQLKEHYRLAILSRGYGRKTKGPIIATTEHTAQDIGDEPAQILSKFPDLMMYIDGDRRRAIMAMEALPEEERPEVILMDDGFQHRYVMPAYSILLTSYYNLFTRDDLLPYGNLRENAMGKLRADTIIITSLPSGLNPIDLRLLEGEISPMAHQDLYFSRIAYSDPAPLFEPDTAPLHSTTPVIGVSGIADPDRYHEYLKSTFRNIRKFVVYPDHHNFSEGDIDEFIDYLSEDPESVILCTEKDAIRLRALKEDIPQEYLHRFYILPIRIDLSPESTKRIIAKALHAISHNGLTI
ncbi:tetraacyldisaccharide 4'-kinase [Porphyromonas sp.]|uniref:tetraacyldisaccharide 4'-kinase n=1 Tax=Porphyromonas sp. TaxID=1924944 RepID=UPI0026DD9AFB|nr:tetraacyldisaccharide 4'-kinase [Porphyromonas sp.]MDO4771266.1 tetraacyldisaccharide 4'-kinase [Porphyromonas sp.]